MQVKAAEIQVNGAHHSLFVVADKNLGVDKARRVFVNFHAGSCELRIKGSGQHVGILFIRNMRHNKLYVNPAFGGIAQGIDHLVVQNQIGRHNMNVAPGLVQYIQINTLSHLLPVHRAVPIGQDEAGMV